jgi:hypothetical protein
VSKQEDNSGSEEFDGFDEEDLAIAEWRITEIGTFRTRIKVS